MSANSVARRSVAAAMVAFLIGCSTPAPPPITDLGDRSCVRQADLGAARALAINSDKPVEVAFDAKSDCLEAEAGRKSLYAVFHLPSSASSYIVTVTSAPFGQSILSPHLLILASDGTVVRELPRSAFLFHLTSLSASIRIHPEDAYLVVASDPESVGSNEQRILTGVQVTTVSTGLVTFNTYSGIDNTNMVTFAHNGSVSVVVRPLPAN